MSADEVARHRSITRHALGKRRRSGGLIALSIEHHRYPCPAWQLGANRILKGLKELLTELWLPDPWTQLTFFLGKNKDLNGTLL